ncbi:MAG: NifB/NifX family molybdenum-iron cluster-binding protein [Desulfitobacteriaceae bacterium]|nr:NifB/NifX family molybdenum-iron cluster-binding protein [Desulfitobacteriaceae bacterium]MDI6878186.1 NifB/NifX family molybdenum-iron cluster-binding protein [Desulfitobacteriaceae bacterium]MDI6913501.1 NifB/NifX family molybdenum-iron cluster-binding protein [Desulfitobacteriaceae bacterium]
MIQVAYCSTNGLQIDSHFATSPAFSIYEIGPELSHLVGRITLTEETPHPDQHPGIQNEDDNVSLRIKALQKCSFVYCSQIGGPAAARLIQSSIYPLKAVDGTSIEEANEKLSQMLKTNPPPWLRKKLQNGKAGNA